MSETIEQTAPRSRSKPSAPPVPKIKVPRIKVPKTKVPGIKVSRTKATGPSGAGAGIPTHRSPNSSA